MSYAYMLSGYPAIRYRYALITYHLSLITNYKYNTIPISHLKAKLKPLSHDDDTATDDGSGPDGFRFSTLVTINPRCGWQPYVSSRVRVTPEWCQSNHAMEHCAPSSVRMPQLPGSVRIKPVIGYALLHLA